MKVRELMKENFILTGKVECDESIIGGRRRRVKRGRGSPKPVVFGAVERGGRVMMKVVPNAEAKSLSPHFRRIAPNVTLITDEWRAYKRIARERGIKHEHIKHKEYMWSRGDIHTNTVEGQWSHLKRSLRGTFVRVSPQYLQCYLDERCFAFNFRNEDRFAVLLERLR